MTVSALISSRRTGHLPDRGATSPRMGAPGARSRATLGQASPRPVTRPATVLATLPWGTLITRGGNHGELR
jgi:hypothetical protein